MKKSEFKKIIKEYVSEVLNENLLLKRRGDKLVVMSDLPTRREQGNETYKNMKTLRASGFDWDKSINSWTIDTNEFNSAKNTISKINKLQYMANTVDDLQEFIEDADNLSRKDELVKKIDTYFDMLTKDVEDAAATQEVRDFLAFQSKIRRRSIHNTIMIYIQNPKATHVEGMRVWREKYGRKVKMGAKAIGIWAPIISNSKSEDKDDVSQVDSPEIDKEIKKKNHMFFRVVNVFDVADTEPIPGKEHLYVTPPKWHDENTPNENADKLFEYSLKLADELNIKITRDGSRRGEMGYAAGEKININNDSEGIARASTLIHEIAHELLHFKETSGFYVDDPSISKHDKETQAEAVSYIVLKHFDIPTKHHATYLSLWKADKERLKKNLEYIKNVSDYIISKIDDIQKESSGEQK